MKKKFVLIALFVLPVVAYLFFSSGVYNFAKLPIKTQKVADIDQFALREIKVPGHSTDTPLSLKEKITLVGYLGDQLKSNSGYTANLNLMIFKYFERYDDFQMVLFVNPGNEKAITDLKVELGRIFDVSKMRFIAISKEKARAHFKTLKTGLDLTPAGDHPDVFIIDRARTLRAGHDEKKPNSYGYDFTQAVEMGYIKDDIKILLAEYRLALKKNNNASPELEQRLPKKEN